MLRTPSRRSILLGGAGLAAAAGLTACTSTSSSTKPQSDQSTSANINTAFPATVAHKYGSTTVRTAPTRIASDGYTDHDAVLALGLVPVGLRQWIPEWKQGVGPWAIAALRGEQPKIWADTTVPYEKIAALAPDLVLDVNSGLTGADYAKLSRIAPTVAQAKGYVDYGTPWDVGSLMIAEALGRKAEMQKLIDAVQAKFAAARAAHPELAGKTANIMTYSGPGTYNAYAGEDTRGRFVTSLGMHVPAAVDKAAGSQFYAEISPEKADLLNADVLILGSYGAGTKAAFEKDKVMQSLDVVKRGNCLFIEDDDVVMAMSSSTVLSLPFAIDKAVPLIAGAVRKQ
ncbi:iron-siderophore ABC transporter substrate-binding protein [Streptacidiphilus cavernicola]|uniref:Iron-siderophore ABC transporter substrate-binding protein n=1 Tax=Streptacidiphilus cavernicola TaxID=3342716 RepID=A0ABV6W587_9ACTN